MPDDSSFQIDPNIAALLPVTGQMSPSMSSQTLAQVAGNTTPTQAPITFRDLSSLLSTKPGTVDSTNSVADGSAPNIISLPATGGYTSGRGKNSIQGIVMHSSDGTEKGDINTLRGGDPSHQVSSHYYVARDGKIYQFVNDQDTAWHAGQTVDNSRYGNSATIGIEQEHIDGKQDWPQVQVDAAAKLVASLRAKYNLSQDQVYGHSQIAPERKQDPLNYPWKSFAQSVTNNLSPPSRGLVQAAPASSDGITWTDLSPYLTRGS
jgi:hypothetical protein